MSEHLGEQPAPYLTGFWPTDLSNFSAFVYHSMPNLNWCGFYLYKSPKLHLGPFQGRPACTEISVGKGVCGSAFQQKKVLVVPNVDEFPGHIVCDSRSKSEVVFPLLWGQGEEPWGVFDVDSPLLNRFQDQDVRLLQNWLQELELVVRKKYKENPWKDSL